MLGPDQRSVVVIGYSGYARVTSEFQLDEALPTAEVLRTGQPLSNSGLPPTAPDIYPTQSDIQLVC